MKCPKCGLKMPQEVGEFENVVNECIACNFKIFTTANANREFEHGEDRAQRKEGEHL